MGWHEWEDLGSPDGSWVKTIAGPWITKIASTSWARGRLDVMVAVGGHADDDSPSNGIAHLSYDDSGENPQGWSQWAPVVTDPHVLDAGVSSLSVTNWGPGRLDLVFRTEGANPALKHVWFDTAWQHQALEVLTNQGPFVDVGALVSQGPGTLDYFGIRPAGRVNSLGHGWYDPGSGWQQLRDVSGGGFMVHAPAAATSWAAGRIDLFNGQGEHSWFERYWSSSADPMGPPHKDGEISAASGEHGLIDLVNKGRDTGVAWRRFRRGWSKWEPLPGYYDPDTGSQTLGGGLAVASWGRDRVDVFATDRGNGRLVHCWFEA